MLSFLQKYLIRTDTTWLECVCAGSLVSWQTGSGTHGSLHNHSKALHNHYKATGIDILGRDSVVQSQKSSQCMTLNVLFEVYDVTVRSWTGRSTLDMEAHA